MKTKVNNNNKLKKISIIASVALLVIFLLFLLFQSLNITRTVNDPLTNNANNNVDTKSDQKTTTNDPLIDTTSDNITLSTKRENDGSLTILTQLTDYSDGTCSLLIESGADKYTTSAPVIYQPTYSTCEGFNVSPTVVPSGVWKITLSVTSKGITNKQTTSVEVQ